MNRLIDYSSRFRILKGGKISLVVGALALGSLVNEANALATISSNVTTSQTFNYSSGNTINITSTGSIIINSDNSAIWFDTSAGGYTLNNSGTIQKSNSNGYATIYITNSSHETVINNYKDILYSVTSTGEGDYAFRVNDVATILNDTGANISAKINDTLDKNLYAFYGLGNVTITNNGTVEGNFSISNGNVTNNGKLSLPYNATNATIGTLVNNASGTIEIGLLTDGTTTTHSQLSTTDATFNDGSTINVNVLNTSTNVSSIGGTTLNNVVSASNSLTINGTLNITDNSALLNFTYTKDGNTIDLNAVQAKTIFDSAVLGGAQGNTKNSAKKLQEIKDAGTYTAMTSVFNALNALSTDAQVSQKVEETTPQTATSSLSASTYVAQGISGIVTQRQNINLGGALSGTNSGDEMFVEKNIWFKPFGSIGSQKNKDGINGFDINTYGLAFGVDGEYEENTKFGLGFFYTNANVEVNNVIQSSDLDVYSLVAYGSNPIIDDKTKFMYQVGYSLQKNSSKRYVSLTSATASADYISQTATVDLKVLRDYKINDDLLIQPMVSSTYRYFKNPSYTETGAGALNLNVEKFSSTEMLMGIGTMAHYKIDTKSKIIANVNIDYDLHHKTQTVTSSYQGASGVTFDTDGIDNGRVSYDIGVGYENQINDFSNINFSYNYQGKGNAYSNNVFSLKYTYKF